MNVTIEMTWRYHSVLMITSYRAVLLSIISAVLNVLSDACDSSHFFLFYMCILPISIMCFMCMSGTSRGQRGGHWIPGTGLTDSCDPSVSAGTGT